MNFDVSTPKGLAEFESFISQRSFVNGYAPTADDAAVFSKFLAAPPAVQYPHTHRYLNTIRSYSTSERAAFPKPATTEHAGEKRPAPAAAAAESSGAAEGDEKVSKSQQKRDAKKAKKLKGDDDDAPKHEMVEISKSNSNTFTVDPLLTPLALLRDLFSQAVAAAYPGVTLKGEDVRIMVRERNYQINSAHDVNKLKASVPGISGGPADIARKIVEHIPKTDVLEYAQISPQGFITVELSGLFLKKHLADQIKFGVKPPHVEPKESMVVDFSSPNIAKQMHVGHLRSTIIGDTMCRILEFMGHDVKRTNHVGDWGTQFGMLICHLQDTYPDFLTNPTTDIGDLTKFYQAAKKRFDVEEGFKTRAQLKVVALQAGEPEARKLWNSLCDISRIEFKQIYDRLDIKLTEKGESFYNAMIPGVIDLLTEKGLVKDSDGAKCIFISDSLPPLMVRKRDGGYGYDSTDMAAIHYRVFTEKATTMIYITDVGQGEHFHLIFEAAKRAGWLEGRRVAHIGFGLVQDKSGQKFKTRSGDTIPLSALLDEAVERMKATLTERVKENKSPLTMDEVNHAAWVIGHASVKYFDLRQNPGSNYIFEYDKMLDDKGDTAVYLLYSRARINSILRKAEANFGIDIKALFARSHEVFALTHETEVALACELVRLNDVLLSVVKDLLPNILCKYLYDVCVAYSKFNTVCKVLGSPEMEGRLLLTYATMQTMDKALNLLGIQPLDKI